MTATHDSVSGWIDALLEGRRLHHSLRFDFEGCIIEVRCDSDELLKELAFYYKEFICRPGTAVDIQIQAIEQREPRLPLDYTRKQPDPGKTRIKEEYVDFPDGRVVRKRLTGMHFLFSGERHLAIGPCLSNPNQVINFVNNRFIQWQLNRRNLLCHAAAVARDARGLAMAGFSGMGKSTLALELMGRDLVFISNDRLMIRRDDRGALQMLGVPKLPRINPGTVLNNPYLESVMPEDEREQVERLSPQELWDLEQKYDVFIDECFGQGKYRLGAEMVGLVLLNWQRDGAPLTVARVDLDGRRDLLGAFSKEVGLFFQRDPRTPEPRFEPGNYIDVMGACPVFELSGGVDFPRAADLCLEFLHSGKMPRP